MGIYLNPNEAGFRESVSSEIYVDKTELISYTNKRLGTEQKYICVSRPRRFGKSMAVKMLTAYYSRGANARTLFKKLGIAADPSFDAHLNQYHVVFLNMQEFLSETHSARHMIEKIQQALLKELLMEYPADYVQRGDSLAESFSQIFNRTAEPFIFIIDEWDCIFREKQENHEGHALYLDFLRNLLKDRSYVALAYMTGILPIKKYGSHSALNMFTEFSMTNPKVLAKYVGFTEAEVLSLCEKYSMDFSETARWYDGYSFRKMSHIYSPKSVVDAMLNEEFDSYWTQTETYEALKIYIEMNFDGLKDAVIEMLAGNHVKINTATFENDMTTFRSRDDVLTLLVHLGYLAYDIEREEVFIPNYEVSREFLNAVQGAGWDPVMKAIRESGELLKATWEGNGDAVAKALEQAHYETSILTYNDENALACVVSLAYYSARTYYTCVREFPSGKGFADLVYLPRKNYLDKPAMIVELKWDQTASGGIAQIKEKNYGKALEEYSGSMLLVAVNYNKKDKKHECLIEKMRK